MKEAESLMADPFMRFTHEETFALKNEINACGDLVGIHILQNYC